MRTFTVLVEALGYPGGCARQGEIVTEEQVGVESLDRLIVQGFLLEVGREPEAHSGEVAESKGDDVPKTLADRVAVGLPAEPGRPLTEAEVSWLGEVLMDVVPLPFKRATLEALTVAELKERIEGMGRTPVSGLKKAEYIDELADAVKDYVVNLEGNLANLEDE